MDPSAYLRGYYYERICIYWVDAFVEEAVGIEEDLGLSEIVARVASFFNLKLLYAATPAMAA